MNILAIETATAVCAAAAVRDGVVLAEYSLHEKHIHSEKLITIVDRVLQESGGYDAIAVSIGPGSFTGLRIGLSVAKGLAFASGKPLVPVPTLEALSWGAVHRQIAQEGDEVIAMIDARRSDVYAAGYHVEHQEISFKWGPVALPLSALQQKISWEKRTVFMGDGVEKFRSHSGSVSSIPDDHWIFPPIEQRLCSAASVGLVGWRKTLRGMFTDPASLEPMYVKDFPILVSTQHSS